MAKIKQKEEFVLSCPPEDLGTRVYAFGQTVKKQKSNNPAKAGERKKPWRSPAGIYMLALGAFLVFWFLYSLIAALVNNFNWLVLLNFGTGFMALVVCLVIIICSVFGLWGKLARFALNHRMVRGSDIANVEDSAEMVEEAYEKAQAPSPFLEVYENYIRATDGDTIKIINRAGIKKIKAFQSHGTCSISLISDREVCEYDFVWLHGLNLPVRELKKLKKLFGDKLETEPLVSEEDRKQARREYGLSGSFHAAPLGVGFLCAAVGGGLIAMHFFLIPDMPIALGAFFMAGGVLFMFAAFEHVPIVKVFIIPLIFGCVFTVMPIAFSITIASEYGISTLFTSIHQFLCSFNGAFCAIAFLEGMGVFILIVAFYNLYKYIRYGEQ